MTNKPHKFDTNIVIIFHLLRRKRKAKARQTKCYVVSDCGMKFHKSTGRMVGGNPVSFRFVEVADHG